MAMLFSSIYVGVLILMVGTMAMGGLDTNPCCLGAGLSLSLPRSQMPTGAARPSAVRVPAELPPMVVLAGGGVGIHKMTTLLGYQNFSTSNRDGYKDDDDDSNDEGRRSDDSLRAQAGDALPTAHGCALLLRRPGPVSAALVGGIPIPGFLQATPSRPKILASAAWLHASTTAAASICVGASSELLRSSVPVSTTSVPVSTTSAAAASERCQGLHDNAWPASTSRDHRRSRRLVLPEPSPQFIVAVLVVPKTAARDKPWGPPDLASMIRFDSWSSRWDPQQQMWNPPCGRGRHAHCYVDGALIAQELHVVRLESFLPIEAMQKYPSRLTTKLHVLMCFFRQLLLRHFYYCSAFTWVVDWSFNYIRQRIQNHPSVVGMSLPSQLHRPNFNRRILLGLSIWVQVSWTSMRIPLTGRSIIGCIVVDAAVFYFGLRTVMYFESSSEDLYNLAA